MILPEREKKGTTEMKRLVMAIVAGICVAATAQTASGPTKSAARTLTTEEIRERQRRHTERLGGRLIKPGTMKGKFMFMDAQDRVGMDVGCDAVAKKVNFFIQFDAYAIKGTVPNLKTADKSLADSGANAAVFLVDDDVLPALLVAPERRWAFVNVRPLAADKPDQERLEFRTRSELWRAFAMVLGAGDTESTACVMNPCVSLADLDKAESGMISMEPLATIQAHAKKIGITPYVRAFYRTACKEGWAPAPTNEYQRAIWDKVMADKERGPANPITIKPPSAKK